MTKREHILRYLTVIKKIRHYKEVTFEEILNSLESESEITGYNLSVSKRTFQRDVDEIRSLFNIDIQFNFSKKVYHITEDEEQAELNNRMLEAFDVFNTLKSSTGFTPYIHFEKRRAQGTEHFHGLLHAIQNHFVVTFSYQKFWENEISTRIVEPLALKECQYRWYIISRDKKDDRIKTFGLDRISDLTITKNKYKYPKGLNVAEQFRDYFGILHDEDAEKSEIVLSFKPLQGKYIKSFPLHESQTELIDNKKEYRISLELFDTYDFIMELLSYGENVKIISPKSLRAKLKDALSSAIIQYKW